MVVQEADAEAGAEDGDKEKGAYMVSKQALSGQSRHHYALLFAGFVEQVVLRFRELFLESASYFRGSCSHLFYSKCPSLRCAILFPQRGLRLTE